MTTLNELETEVADLRYREPDRRERQKLGAVLTTLTSIRWYSGYDTNAAVCDMSLKVIRPLPGVGIATLKRLRVILRTKFHTEFAK